MTDKEKLIKIKKLADAMYYAAQYLTTDASRLHKAMEEYYQFIIHEYFKEEPVSEELEEASKNYALNNTPWDDCKDEIQESFKAGAKWHKKQMMANTADAMIGLPYENKDGGYTHLIDVSRPLPVGNNKIAIRVNQQPKNSVTNLKNQLRKLGTNGIKKI